MKRTNKISGKGILHDDLIIEVLGKKEEDPSEFYNLFELLEDFVGKHISITITEDQPVEQTED